MLERMSLPQKLSHVKDVLCMTVVPVTLDKIQTTCSPLRSCRSLNFSNSEGPFPWPDLIWKKFKWKQVFFPVFQTPKKLPLLKWHQICISKEDILLTFIRGVGESWGVSSSLEELSSLRTITNNQERTEHKGHFYGKICNCILQQFLTR